LAEAAPGANQGFLGHLFGAATVAAVAPGHIDQRPLPALHNAGEGLRIAAEDAVNKCAIGERGFGRI
jgi:hypothetical protein